MAEQAAIGQPTYTVVQHDTPAGPRWYVVNESAPGNTRKYLASFDNEQAAQGEADVRNAVDAADLQARRQRIRELERMIDARAATLKA